MTKRVLITGKNSYIGNSFIEYCKKNQINLEINELDTRGDDWKAFDFSSYDTIIHLAGIAHIKETSQNEHLYYEINRDLAIDLAEKTKKSGVGHFIFMSTMSVYGLVEGHIDEKTPAKPNNAYGKSKLQAEEEIKILNSNDFIVSIIRPPMIYGPGSRGNYALLSKFAKKTKIFPSLNNKRSMLFIDNFSIFLINLVNMPKYGFFFPQDEEYVSTSSLVLKIANLHKNKYYSTSLFNWIIKKLNNNTFKKVFGNLTYSHKLSSSSYSTNFIDFDESIRRTESD